MVPSAAEGVLLRVAVDAPQHSGLPRPLDYASQQSLAPGTLVRVPLGRREVPGVVWAGDAGGTPDLDLRPVTQALLSLPPLNSPWCALVEFAAGYYQRSIGEVALSVLPPELRKLDDEQLASRIKRLAKALQLVPEGGLPAPPPPLSDEQAEVLARFEPLVRERKHATVLLHGATGSGKTEVYLRAAARTLESGRQALVLVPEINLTPQLEARFSARFAGRHIVSLHSALTPAQRLRNWLAAHLGLASGAGHTPGCFCVDAPARIDRRR